MLHPLIGPGKSEIEGRGLVATGKISQGEAVWRLDESEKRMTQEELDLMPEERRKLAYQYGDRFILVTDGSATLNHSCSPNLWWADDETLVAKRDIEAGDEVTYDYATTEINPVTMPDMECKCGSVVCRKIISYKDCLDQNFQKENLNHLPSWTRAFIAKNSPI